MEQPTVTPREAALVIGVSKATLYRWIKRGWIKYLRLPNGYIRITKDELENTIKIGDVKELFKDYAESAKW